MRRLQIGAALLLAAALTVTLSSSGAQLYRRHRAGNPDRVFMERAAQGGLAEVTLGRLVADKASTDTAWDFGRRMAEDHSRANDQLRDLASRKGVTLPDNLNRNDRRFRDYLTRLSGIGFDRSYMARMVSDHLHDIAEFRREAQRGRDPDVRAWARDTLPTLEEHLRMAREDQRTLAGTRPMGRRDRDRDRDRH